MKSAILLLLAALLLAASVFFFHEAGTMLAAREYLAGILHIFVGFATIRAGSELARLGVVLHVRS